MKKIGRFERLASALAVSQVVYQAIPASPMGCGLAPRSFGRGPCAARRPAVSPSSEVDKRSAFTEEETPQMGRSCKVKCKESVMGRELAKLLK